MYYIFLFLKSDRAIILIYYHYIVFIYLYVSFIPTHHLNIWNIMLLYDHYCEFIILYIRLCLYGSSLSWAISCHSAYTRPTAGRFCWIYLLIRWRPRSIWLESRWNLRACASSKSFVKNCKPSWCRCRTAPAVSGVLQKPLVSLDSYPYHIR
jgi:hypothetical protein